MTTNRQGTPPAGGGKEGARAPPPPPTHTGPAKKKGHPPPPESFRGPDDEIVPAGRNRHTPATQSDGPAPRGDAQPVRQGDLLGNRKNLVVAVGVPGTDPQNQIDLRRRGHGDA